MEVVNEVVREYKEQLKTMLWGLGDEELLPIYNAYIDNYLSGEGHIHGMWELYDYTKGCSQEDLFDILIDLGCNGFDKDDNYFIEDGCGNLKSYEYICDCMDLDDFIDTLVEKNTLGIKKLEEILDKAFNNMMATIKKEVDERTIKKVYLGFKKYADALNSQRNGGINNEF